VVPTVTFDGLYVFFVLSLERRRILHVNVTAHPYTHGAWQRRVRHDGGRVIAATGDEDDRRLGRGRHVISWRWASVAGWSAGRRSLREYADALDASGSTARVKK
jgi:hypothetical protein